VNIADPADTDGFGYPQLSVEYIVESDPDLIFVTDCCGESVDTISARPGWENIAAVQTGSIVVVDDDIASRWGPRTTEFLLSVAEAVSVLVSTGE
jgi:iron complex transport system substrate-binding protein